MTITKLAWRDLVPDTDSYQEIFAQPHLIDENDPLFSDTQPRLQFALWLLVAVRLLVPVSLGQSPASVMNYVPEQQMSEILEDASIPAQVPQQVTALPVEGTAFTDEVLPAEASQTATEAPTASEDLAEESARFRPAPLTICYFV